ncbi:MAG: hypothetical protein ACM3O7_01355 [Acidobacteriota bacterium]
MTTRGRLVRRLSALVLVAWVAALAAILVHRQLRRVSPAGSLDFPEQAEKGGEKPVRVHRGFVYSDTLGVEPNFRISASETVEYASGWVELHNVEISLYEGGRVVYGLVGETSRFNQSRREAEISGGAQLSLKAGVAVRAGAFHLHGADRILESVGPVTFAGPGWGGVAGGSRVSLANDIVELVDGVSMTARGSDTGQPSVVLLAPRVTYERRQAVVRFPGGLTVLQGGLRLRSPGARLLLTQPDGALDGAVFEDPVMLDGVTPQGAALEGEAGQTRVHTLADGRWHVTADAASALGWVRGWWQEPDRSWREMTAWRLEGEGTRQAIEWLEGQGLACAYDYSVGVEPRSIEGEKVRLGFVSGQPETGEAQGAVTVSSGENSAEGGDLDFSLRSRRFSLMPQPGGRVTATSPDGVTRADRMDGDEQGSVVASGQVSGIVERGQLWAGAGVPVHFAAGRATVARGQTRLTLEGDARLWQGERLVRADTIDYDTTTEQVRGNGSVLTTTDERSIDGKVQSLRVNARAFQYDRAASTATYEGDVVLDEPRAVSRCQRLVVSLSPGGEVLLATMAGGVTVTEKGTSRVLRGERARLMPPEDLFEMWGSPVIAEEPGGNQIKADHLLWRRASDTLLVLGGADNPSETLYHPAQPLPDLRPAGTPGPTATRRPRPGGPGRTP